MAARSSTSARNRWFPRRDQRAPQRADLLRAGDFCRLRGHLQGADHPAYAADVGHERDPRHHPGRRDSHRSWRRLTGEIILGLVAVTLATTNVVGGFVVTDR